MGFEKENDLSHRKTKSVEAESAHLLSYWKVGMASTHRQGYPVH